MILVDVGNSTIHFAQCTNGKLGRQWTLPSRTSDLSAIKRSVKNEPLIVCSVVPAITKLFAKLPNTKIIGKDINVPLKCFYNKGQVGQDRLVAAYAAHTLYPKARIVIDFGTAITFDFLNKNGDYEGGIILPGIGSTLRTLSTCAMLPKHLTLRSVKTLIPRNTNESISKGVDIGFTMMLQGLIEDYKKKLGLTSDKQVIITGGEGFFIAKKIDTKCILDRDLIFKGLQLLA